MTKGNINKSYVGNIQFIHSFNLANINSENALKTPRHILISATWGGGLEDSGKPTEASIDWKPNALE